MSLEQLLMTPESEQLLPPTVHVAGFEQRGQWNEASRLAILRRQGSHYLARNMDGTWGIAGKTLPMVLKRLRGSPYAGIYKMETRDLPSLWEHQDLVLRLFRAGPLDSEKGKPDAR